MNCQFCTYFKGGYCEVLELNPCYPQKGCDYFSKRGVNDEYKRGWNDALSKALKEAYTIHSEEGVFKVVQAETLIGLGYVIDEPHLEQESIPEIKTVTNAKEAEAYPINENTYKGFVELLKCCSDKGKQKVRRIKWTRRKEREN